MAEMENASPALVETEDSMKRQMLVSASDDYTLKIWRPKAVLKCLQKEKM